MHLFKRCTFAESKAPARQLDIKTIHIKVPFSLCSATQQHTSAASAAMIAPSQ
ncbi:hypothetical protein PLUTE_a2898 [Pseudoalteromonas luteoviolacea DSM 6061]|nr:hypothetical protein [Pseudoalteromonas luteoviolacea DSM 6061]